MLQGYAAAIAAVMPAVRATGLLVSTCTFYQPNQAQDVGGAPSGTYTAVSNLSNIPCTAPPKGTGEGIDANEEKRDDAITTKTPLHVLLDGYYGAVTVTLPTPPGGTVNGPQTWFKALIDGTYYDILGIEHDSQKQMTRMYVRTAML